MVEAQLHATPNPLINITIQGRHDTYPRRRGLTRIPELRSAGINISFGHDCVMDPWYPLGQADMLEVASMGVHAVPMTSREAMRWTFDAVTVNPARAMHLQGYGLTKDCKANFVVLQARDPIEAIRLKATRLKVVRGGKVISETPEIVSTLAIDGRPQAVNGANYAPSDKN
jgi:cytosine deaminase